MKMSDNMLFKMLIAGLIVFWIGVILGITLKNFSVGAVGFIIGMILIFVSVHCPVKDTHVSSEEKK